MELSCLEQGRLLLSGPNWCPLMDLWIGKDWHTTWCSCLLQFLAAPREGHLEQCLHIFAYLKKYHCLKIVFNDSALIFDKEQFQQCKWEEFYPGAEDVLPPNVPRAQGKPLMMMCLGDAVMRRLHMGILILLNKALIIWYLKRQNVETSEFITMKTAVEMIEGLRYKLQMMGIKTDGSMNILCDNESVVMNTMRPKSTLKK